MDEDLTAEVAKLGERVAALEASCTEAAKIVAALWRLDSDEGRVRQHLLEQLTEVLLVK